MRTKILAAAVAMTLIFGAGYLAGRDRVLTPKPAQAASLAWETRQYYGHVVSALNKMAYQLGRIADRCGRR